ncbi:MAG: SRPBCC domain-containing protein [Nitrososphaeraceae archaeon]
MVLRSKKLSGYFATAGASSPLDEGKEVSWDFHDFPGAFPVHVKQTIKNKKIVLEWANSEGGNTQVVMNFEPLDKDSTLVRIEEYGEEPNTRVP